ncbi:MAG TPA: radical SAM protein [Phycisphaerae bacterium]|nr:radical SAM protein [Phycisphaerae bacterium]
MAGDRDRFVIDSFRPAYFDPRVRDSLPRRRLRAVEALRACRSCPRNCGVNRLADEIGFCAVGRQARVCSAFAHFGEESCLVGSHGSGTIFFGGCNLRCVFCQNADISQGRSGEPMSADEIAAVMLALQERGCHNINFVTPEHVVPQTIEAVTIAIERRLRLPIVYNTSAYDSVESLYQLDGLIDIYMPDFKLCSPEACERYLGARDYADRAREAIREMHRQVGDLCCTPDGVAARGLLVRHLVMPGLLDESAAIFRWLADLSPDTFINIMGQYRPGNRVGQTIAYNKARPAVRFSEIDRRPTRTEFARALDTARKAGLWRSDEVQTV